MIGSLPSSLSLKKTFLKFDIVAFYHSITKELLTSAIKWAKNIAGITEKEVSIIIHCIKMFLFNKEEWYWVFCFKLLDFLFIVFLEGLGGEKEEGLTCLELNFNFKCLCKDNFFLSFIRDNLYNRLGKNSFLINIYILQF